jgi:DNA-binding NarL/FixJ family response regulator
MRAKIRILLAEDQAMVRGALTALLRLEVDMEVVAEVSGGDQVLEAAMQSQPDVALLDVEMPGGDGLSAAGALHKSLPSCRIVILTTFDAAVIFAGRWKVAQSVFCSKMRRLTNWPLRFVA